LGLGLELETKQASQPLTLLCSPNLARKDKEWTKVGSKWKCKVGTCTVTYCAKWLLTKHLKEVHGLVAEKAKLGRPSTFVGGPQHEDHAKMDARILGNAMAMQRRNDQKVVSRVRAKVECEKKKKHQLWTAQKFQNFQGPSELATMNQHSGFHCEG